MSPSLCEADDYNICPCNMYVLTDTELVHRDQHQWTENDRIINSSFVSHLKTLSTIIPEIPNSYARYWCEMTMTFNLWPSKFTIFIQLNRSACVSHLKVFQRFYFPKNGTDRQPEKRICPAEQRRETEENYKRMKAGHHFCWWTVQSVFSCLKIAMCRQSAWPLLIKDRHTQWSAGGWQRICYLHNMGAEHENMPVPVRR